MAQIAVFAVFDGHGGAQVSHFLANALHAKLLADETLRTDPRRALRNACASCDEEIVRAFGPRPIAMGRQAGKRRTGTGVHRGRRTPGRGGRRPRKWR